ncbi:hypothetical protein LU699_13230 [Luteimonas fraxinea]|uniref:Uncharacterized protein n=1 Tax=Luteimonas fraxinea TaxID=2901869 RepID=A0ABS8UEY1_9GAMM|nr:hypothetical protein [Luteimonas fraxinea]MCD9098023.1 hypothetical protein [Luteimonas fraxinea]UHH09250.1 hypothetical protein LU699_13230 [Luteimonas fraxinea]
MEPLFRFVLARPPVAQDPANPSIRLTQDSPYQAGLRRLEGAKNRDGLGKLAISFISSDQFLSSPAATPAHDSLARLFELLDRLEGSGSLTPQDLHDAIKDAFDASPADALASQSVQSSATRLRDSITAIKQVPAEHKRPIEALVGQMRTIEVMQKAVDDREFPQSAAALRRYRRRSLELPSKDRLPSALRPSKEDAGKVQKEREKREGAQRKELEELVRKERELSSAISELTRLGPDAMQSSDPESSDLKEPVDGLQLETMLRRSASQSEKLSDIELRIAEKLLDQPRERGGPPTGAATIQSLSVSPRIRASAGAPAISASQFRTEGLRLSKEAASELSAATRKILGTKGAGVERTGIQSMLEGLTHAREEVRRDLADKTAPVVERSFRKVGGTLVATKMTRSATMLELADFTGGFFPWPASSVPKSIGDVKPAGIADLLMVRQQLIGYERADVAHIENVLRGEKKEREHTTRRETEELTFRETEVSTSEERELETTDRFEMTRESSETIKEDASLKAGLTVSGKYGPTVEFTASAEGSMSRSKEEATKSASSFSQDVTQRSANKITERVLERSSLRVTNEVIEKNTHTLDNVGGAGHISGVYQWVNKIYRAQMFNYGLRTMFDFMVPEPAAFLIKAMQKSHDSIVELDKPEPFTLTPAQVDESNYGTWVKAYGATDILPPPELYRFKSADFKANDEDPPTMLNHSGQIAIDEGYKAIAAYVGTLVLFWQENFSLFFVVGDKFRQVGLSPAKTYPTTHTLTLGNETSSLPFALITNRVANVGFTIEVKCQRTDAALDKWRAETHAKLTTAYRARLSEYEEKLASIEMQAGIAIRGANPALNLERMKDELKKDCISILTEQHFDLFNSIGTAPSTGLPQIRVAEAALEGAYVRFFEQAFEWEHITWVTYPYFWGRKSEWEDRIAFDDPDPLFTQFLKAGFCRVTVPARPGFEGAVDHFMTYGELWEGGPLPPISSDLYLPIADELAERLDRPGDEVPQGEPWTVKIPTSLVHLRPDDKLPKWDQNPEGEWVEV